MQNTSTFLPLWGAGELAAIAQDYRKSVKPVFSETVPENVKNLARMQDTGHQLVKMAQLYQNHEENYDVFDFKELIHHIAEHDPDRVTIQRFLDTLPEDERNYDQFLQLMYPNDAKALYQQGWKLSDGNPHSKYWVYTNDYEGKAYLAFDHYTPNNLSVKSVLDKSTDDSVVFNQIPRGAPIDTSNARYSEETGAAILNDVLKYRARGYDVRFTGYSLGGHVAKYWGSKLNVYQDVINAHIFPNNDFGETFVSTNFHTTATDETSFKYGILPNGTAPAFGENDTHTVYPPSNEIPDLNIMKGNIWGNHLKQSFTAPQETLNIEQGRYAAAASERYANYAGAAAVGLTAADIAMDVADKDYKGAAFKGTTAALGLASPVALNEGVGAYMTYEGGKEVKEGIQTKQWGTIGRGTRHIAEGVAQTASILSKVDGAMPGAAAAVGGIELAFQASSDAKAGDKHSAAIHGTESALLGAGAGLFVTPLPGARLAAAGALATAGVVAVGDRIGRKIWSAKQSHVNLIPMTHSRDVHMVTESSVNAPVPDAHITGPRTFSEHATSRQAPMWHVPTSTQHSKPLF